MIILIRIVNTSFKDYDVFITVYYTSLILFSYTAFRDRNLINDLKRFVVLYNLVLETIYMISSLFYLLLIY